MLLIYKLEDKDTKNIYVLLFMCKDNYMQIQYADMWSGLILLSIVLDKGLILQFDWMVLADDVWPLTIRNN